MTTPTITDKTIKTAWLLDWYMGDTEANHWYITTAPFNITYNSQTYLSSPLPTSIGRLADTVKMSETKLAIGFAGVDITFKQSALGAQLVGRPFNVYRVYFNDDYSINTVMKRYAGLITAVTFDDVYPTEINDRMASFTVLFQLRSLKDVLTQKVSGRFTNQADMQRFFPTDTSMQYVSAERDRLITLGRGQ